MNQFWVGDVDAAVGYDGGDGCRTQCEMDDDAC